MHELPRELGLQLRMCLALALSLLIIVAALVFVGGLVVSLGDEWWKGLLLFFGFPLMFMLPAVFMDSEEWASWRSRQPRKADEVRVRTALERLALLAGAPVPLVEVTANRTPLSWTTSFPWREPKVHVSTGLLDLLEDRELHAVLAHELAHVVHRDALLMTLLAGPPAYLLRGLRAAMEDDPVRAVMSSFIWVPFLVLPAAIMLALSRVISRARELAADRGAAVLTGSPASVAAALVAVDDGLHALPALDLRKAAALDAFHFVPAKRPRWFLRPWATHPSTASRVERMQRFEAAIQR